MMQRKRFVENGIKYVRKGDYYLPNLAVPENNHIIGEYGNLRKKFLKSSKKSLYSILMLTGKLFEHLHEIDEKAQAILDVFMSMLNLSNINLSCSFEVA
jgi:hypothetical protein